MSSPPHVRRSQGSILSAGYRRSYDLGFGFFLAFGLDCPFGSFDLVTFFFAGGAAFLFCAVVFLALEILVIFLD
ncbi:MAG: hypothetical protein IT343_12495 [Candidatus Melainabacteria bacterium]|nr:hypothetical protein [Candidatus Melainabacteria bacterium]